MYSSTSFVPLETSERPDKNWQFSREIKPCHEPPRPPSGAAGQPLHSLLSLEHVEGEDLGMEGLGVEGCRGQNPRIAGGVSQGSGETLFPEIKKYP